jgi:nicotinamidase-related amidase
MSDEAPPADVAALRALCDAATSEPWIATKDWHGMSSLDGPYISVRYDEGDYHPVVDSDDAAFIAEMRTAAPAMLGEIERLREQLAAEKRRVERVRALQSFEVSQSGTFAIWDADLEAALADESEAQQ